MSSRRDLVTFGKIFEILTAKAAKYARKYIIDTGYQMLDKDNDFWSQTDDV